MNTIVIPSPTEHTDGVQLLMSKTLSNLLMKHRPRSVIDIAPCEDIENYDPNALRPLRYSCSIEVTYKTRTGVHVRRQRLSHYLYRYVFKDINDRYRRERLSYLHVLAHKQVNYQYYIYHHPKKERYVNSRVSETSGLGNTYRMITALMDIAAASDKNITEDRNGNDTSVYGDGKLVLDRSGVVLWFSTRQKESISKASGYGNKDKYVLVNGERIEFTECLPPGKGSLFPDAVMVYGFMSYNDFLKSRSDV
jgi:hypothetical protein